MPTALLHKRRSGISMAGELPWGSHFCLLYETEQDLLEVLVPYFRAGLEQGELCSWAVCSPLRIEQARRALREAVEGFEEHESRGQIELVPAGQVPLDEQAAQDEIAALLDRSVSGGFDGLRIARLVPLAPGDRPAWTCPGTEAISSNNVIAACLYPRAELGAAGFMDVVKNHRFALVRNAGRWEVVESSEARTIREDLRRTEERLQILFSHMSEGFAYHRIVQDEDGSPCDYVFLDLNESFEKMTGLERKKILGRRVTEVLPGIERDPTDWIGKYGRVALTGEPIRFESHSAQLDRWYAVSAFSSQRGYFAVTFDDITERKRAEVQLRESKAQLEQRVQERTAELTRAVRLLEEENEERIRTERSLRLEEARLDALVRLGQLGDASVAEISAFILEQAIALTGSKIGFVGFLSEDESVYTLHAVSRDVVRECAVECDPLQWHVAEAGIWAEAVYNHQTLFVNDYSQPHPRKHGLPPGHPPVDRFMVVPFIEGNRIKLLAGVGNKAAVYDKSDERQILLLLGGMWNLFQRSERTAELSRAVEQLQEEVRRRALAEAGLRKRTEQLRALASELTLAEQRERRRLADVLHDELQQLLVGARFRLAKLHRAADPTIRQTAEQVQELIDKSIECSRTLTGELSPPVLHRGELVPALEWLANWVQQNYDLAVDLVAPERAVLESEDLTILLFQAIRELLFNAAKHARVREVQVNLRRLDDRIEVTVSDQGVGFDPEAHRPELGKTGGFGLFSIRERLELLGGSLQVDSGPGRGSRFTLLAPCGSPGNEEEAQPTAPAGDQEAGQAPVAPEAQASCEPAGRRIRVLLVEDHLVVRQGISALLKTEPDIEIVAEATNGQEAVDLVRRLRPEVVTMDVKMPGMDGIEATRIIHREFPEVAVIGLSTFEEERQARAMREAGARDYLTKSGPSGDLLAAIRAFAKAGSGRTD